MKILLLSLIAHFATAPVYAQTSIPTALDVDRLVSEQKYDAALKEVREQIDLAKKNQKGVEWAKLISKEAMIEIALHGYETAARDLQDRKWPGQPVAQAMVSIVYSRVLQTYVQSYSYEIRGRERVDSKGKLDLKTMTADQIYLEAIRAMTESWSQREALGRQPKSALGELVVPNRYPEGIRDTLRDSLTYLFVELLADTSGWTPQQSNEVYLLSAQRLLEKPPVGEGALTDPKVHPLEKISYLLHDLRKWNEGRKPGAALEATLALAERLHNSFTDDSSHQAIRTALKSELENQKRNPWVSMGYALLATFYFNDEAPDARVKTRALAQQGEKLAPQSPGASRCRDIIHDIEQPQYQLEAMKVDGPGKRSIGIKYQNLKKIYFRSYTFDLLSFAKNTRDYSLRPGSNEIDKLLTGMPDQQWETDLTETTDYRQHQAYSVPPVHKPGFYIVLASAKPQFPREDNVIAGVQMQFSDLVLSHHRMMRNEALEVEVASGSTGERVSGAQVALYKTDYRNSHDLVNRMATDDSGVAKFKIPLEQAKRSNYFLIAEKNGQSVASENPFNVGVPSTGESVWHSFVYTDRSIYRPGQKIFWKVIAYRGRVDLGVFNVEKAHEVTVDLRDANSQVVSTTKVKTNSYGTASGEFTVPAGKLLGQWMIRTSMMGVASVRVEEYKRPTFEVKFVDQANSLRLNREAKIQASTNYYFGLPVTAGSAKWSVTRTVVFPWWCFWGDFGFFRGGGNSRSQVIATGRVPLQADGKFTVVFNPKADEKLSSAIDDLKYRYEVHVDVTDEGGETRGQSQSFVVGFSAVEATLSLDKEFYRAGETPVVQLQRTDLNGKGLGGKGQWRLVRLKGPQVPLTPADQPQPAEFKKASKLQFTTPGDLQLSRWNPNYRPDIVLRGWEAGDAVGKGSLGESTDGKSLIPLPKLEAGAYRLVYETQDAYGSQYDTQKEFVVTSGGSGGMEAIPLPAYFAIDHASARVGEKVRLLAYSGFANQQIILETFRAGKVIKRQRLVAGKDSAVIEVPITEGDRGGLGFTLRMIRDHQSMDFSQSVSVPWDNRELKLSWSTFRDKLRPGGHETWTLAVKGPNSKSLAAGSAEILAYMYDRSLDIFAPHHPPDILSLYPDRTQSELPEVELGLAPQAYAPSYGFNHAREFTSFSEDQVAFYPRYGVGGPGRRGGFGMEAMMDAAPERMAKSQMAAAVAPMAKKAKDVEPKKEAPAQEIRGNFAETAFWKPHLISGKDGTVKIEFDVPDSVTSWKVWAHAVTDDLMGGRIERETRSVKDLMIRPYLPRFLREGDVAQIQLVINNASDRELSGKTEFDIIDPQTQKSLLKDFFPVMKGDRGFKIAAGKSATQTIQIKTPARVGPIAIRATASSGSFMDGELQPIPVLPGRFHLAQSKFVTLKDAGKRQMAFEDLARSDDPSRINEQVVVTLDAQLFYSVLSALPYIIQSPDECVEQTLNTFVSTGILNSMFKKFPAIEKMAREFSSRKTQLESWDAPDPNRKMALEETPWLVLARGGEADDKDMQRVLDSRVSRAVESGSLSKLEKSQTSIGGFPWFPGGPPSPWMTIYTLYGFSKALEFGVDVPKSMTRKAWAYLHVHYVDTLLKELMAHDSGWEIVTFLNYVLSNYPDASWSDGIFTAQDRKTMLDFSFKHWKDHSPYLKGYLALTLERSQRAGDAKLVWDSVMDSAKTTEDEGTHWAAEDRSWLWYNDTIETHAFALRTGSELGTPRKQLDGLVQWLFLNKKLNHWKSTRATAEVIYSLAHYLRKTDQLGVVEKAHVKAGPEVRDFEFRPDKYTGKKNQIVLPASAVSPSLNPITVEKSTPGQMFASATWHYSTEKMPAEARGDFLSVTRSYFKRTMTTAGAKLQPLSEGAHVQVGDEIEVQLSLRSKHPAEYVHLMDPRAAGFEPSDTVSQHKWDLGIYWYEAIRDSGTHFFFEHLPQGEYKFRYRIRAAIAGVFKASPATLQPMYAPEFNAFSAGNVLTVDSITHK